MIVSYFAVVVLVIAPNCTYIVSERKGFWSAALEFEACAKEVAIGGLQPRKYVPFDYESVRRERPSCALLMFDHLSHGHMTQHSLTWRMPVRMFNGCATRLGNVSEEYVSIQV